jgi:hypothetical protein
MPEASPSGSAADLGIARARLLQVIDDQGLQLGGVFMPVAVHRPHDRCRYWPENCFHVVVAATADAGRRGCTTTRTAQLMRTGFLRRLRLTSMALLPRPS